MIIGGALQPIGFLFIARNALIGENYNCCLARERGRLEYSAVTRVRRENNAGKREKRALNKSDYRGVLYRASLISCH